MFYLWAEAWDVDEAKEPAPAATAPASESPNGKPAAKPGHVEFRGAQDLSRICSSAVFNADGRLLVATQMTQEPHGLAVWDVDAGREIWRAPGALKIVDGVLTPDGRRAVAFPSWEMHHRGRQATFDLATGERVAETELHGAMLTRDALSPSAKWLVAALAPSVTGNRAMFANAVPADAEIVLQSFPDGKTKIKLTGPSQPTACAFSADEKLLALGYQDGSVSLRRVPEGDELFHVGLTSGAVKQAGFSPDGLTLAANDATSPIRFLDLSQLRQSLAEVALDW
jgi:WD40 repeat protein